MSNACPDCGAIYHNNRTCQEAFNEFLVLEFTDADYGAVHFLTVACYMIQHGQYSDAGLAWIAGKLKDFLESGVTQEQIRRQAARETGQEMRTWHVTRQPGDPPQAKIAWSVTILDVASSYTDAQSYRESVTR